MQKNVNTKILFYCFIVFLFSVGVTISLQSILAGWTLPVGVPPNGNTPPPLTTGSGMQAKLGSLLLNTDAGPNGLIVAAGKVGISSTSPNATLGVNGTIQASGDICTDVAGGKCLSSASGSGGMYSDVPPSKGLYTAWGEEDCKAGFHKLYQGWMYTGNNQSGYGGNWICSKTRRGSVYRYFTLNPSWRWDNAPPCSVCAKNESTLGQCYNNWGDKTCASGFSKMYDGQALDAGSGGANWKNSLVCATKGSETWRYYYGAGTFAETIDCSVCCSDAGGTFTSYGDYNTATKPNCPAGYDKLYSGNMFQSGVYSGGYGSNAVCGDDTAANTQIYLYYQGWVNVPCSVCSKSTTVGQCITTWGSDTKTFSGYNQIYKGGIYIGGQAGNQGGGMACVYGEKTSEIVYNSSLSWYWADYPCAVYCDSKDGAQYTSWGTNTCASGYDKVYSGYIYQGGTTGWYGGEFKCDSGYGVRHYIMSSPGVGVVRDGEPCAQCVKKSAAGVCYTHYGNQTCAAGFIPVNKGYINESGSNQGHASGVECTSDNFSHRTIVYTYDQTNNAVWEEARPCALCCQAE